jgi:eukaryotic-like serine/threonine-protein kinase
VHMEDWTPPAEFDGYRILRALGHGGMGRVFLGEDVLLERRVAVKFIASGEPNESSRERFLVEGRAIARLSHPNVVSIYRVGEAQGHPYLVAEFVRGQNLERVAKPVTQERVVRIGVGLARGLAAAHRQGVLHRDIKPSNIVLSDAGEPKLLDFGLARFVQTDDAASAEQVARHAIDESTAALAPNAESSGVTNPRAVVGTPRYMAPETLEGQPATRRSDIFSLGAVLFELLSGAVPERREGLSVPPLLSVVPSVSPNLAEVVDCSLAFDPALRFSSADQLVDALEGLLRVEPLGAAAQGTPYRGLRPFEAENQAVFFGREAETRAVLERLRSDFLVVVAGDSGVGKSSLCRAGILPLVAGGLLDGSAREWMVADCLPGRQPIRSLAHCMAAILDTDEEALVAWISSEPAALARALQKRRQRRPNLGLVLLIDQAEELFTLAGASEANLIGEALSALAAARAYVLIAVRGDFVTRVASLKAVGDDLAQSLYILRPLTEEKLRQVIIGPARTQGVSFETEAMVDSLVASARSAPGGLPLLQFALAELWDARDVTRSVIPRAALDAMGGVEGSLARHADTVLAGLLPEQRAEAGRILLRLVTVERTRARRTIVDLGAEAGPARVALDALVEGRLLVVREADGEAMFELAHEALIEGWDTLRDWLGAAASQQRVVQRLETAAADWQRLGHSEDALWHGRQLVEAREVDGTQLRSVETAFLAASRREQMRRRLWRAALLVFIPVLLLLALFVSQVRAREALAAQVTAQLNGGRMAFERARLVHAQALERAAAAFALYDGTVGKPPRTPPSPQNAQWDEAEAEWGRARALQSEADVEYVRATQFFEAAVLLEGRRGDARELRSEALFGRLTLAEERHRSELVTELTEQLLTSDATGAWTQRVRAPATLSLSLDPPMAQVTLERYLDENGRFQPTLVEGAHANRVTYLLPPGSYRIKLQAPGRATVLYPVLLARAAEVPIRLRLPIASDVPPGFVYVAAGSFFFGSADEESLRMALDAPPLHEVYTDAYLIAKDEFTFGEWLSDIERLPSSRAAKLIPGTSSEFGRLSVKRRGQGLWAFEFNNGAALYLAGPNGIVHYQGRTRNSSQAWMRFPALAISPTNVIDFATSNGSRMRLCTEQEWERAARGADGRSYASGDSPPPPDAENYDRTYGRVSDAFGPDEVGRHSGDDSPFGLRDVGGNALEIVGSGRPGVRAAEKGGAWYSDANFTGRLARHGPLDMNSRSILLGVRWCSDLQSEHGGQQ